ncbi:MAG: hypothetical protein MZV63_37115 [Marinilabiliales bacterium]|nr:hypothetical protein [Marinilabiliales bacterium]
MRVLGELYSGYMHLVYGVCLKYLKDRDESKDAVMQIFEKLIIEITETQYRKLQKLAACGHKELLPYADSDHRDRHDRETP